MDGKESVCKIIRAILDVEMGMNRDLLLDYIIGRQSQAITSRGLDNTENYGSGEEKDDEHWNLVLDQAIEAGLLKDRTSGIAVMAKGKKFLKKPTAFELKEEEEGDEMFTSNNIDGLVEDVLSDGSTVRGKAKPGPKSQTSQRKLALIQAIDRHIALDDYATNHNIDFDEVMDDIEGIVAGGMKLDLNYFGKEVLGDDAIAELFDYYESADNDKLDKAFDEYGDVYTMDELRLGRIMWRVTKIK